jgi:hypothetical protein
MADVKGNPQYGMPQQQQYVYPQQQYIYPQAVVYQQPEVQPYVEAEPLVQTQPPLQPPQVVVAPAAPVKKSCCSRFCSVMTFFLVFIIASMAIAGFSMSIVALAKDKREATTQPLYLVGGYPKNMETTPFVVSYHPFANITRNQYDRDYYNYGPEIVTAGFGNTQEENKVMQSYGSSSPYLVDAGTKTAPYKDSLLVARLTNNNDVVINSITKNKATATYDNFYRRSQMGTFITKIEGLLKIREEAFSYNSYYVMIYTLSDGSVRAIPFSVASNDVTSFGEETNIGTGTNATIVGLTDPATTFAVAVGSDKTKETSFYACGVAPYSPTKIQCGLLNKYSGVNMNVVRGIPAYGQLSFLFFDPATTTLRLTTFTSFNTGSYGGAYTKKIGDILDKRFTDAVIIKSVESPSYVVYAVKDGVLKACPMRLYGSNSDQFTGCTYTDVASDLSQTPNVRAVIVGSQVFFGYQNNQRQFVTKVVGVLGNGFSEMVMDVTPAPVSFAQYTTTPLLVNANNATVTLLFPGENYQSARVITYIARGGVSPIGISPAQICRGSNQYAEIQKVGIFTACRSSLVPGAKYYAGPTGSITTFNSNGYKVVGTALDRHNIILSIY